MLAGCPRPGIRRSERPCYHCIAGGLRRGLDTRENFPRAPGSTENWDAGFDCPGRAAEGFAASLLSIWGPGFAFSHMGIKILPYLLCGVSKSNETMRWPQVSINCVVTENGLGRVFLGAEEAGGRDTPVGQGAM